MRQRKTPQEKKQLSLEKDRRNSYGENDKASRKNIPRAKSGVNRANRRAEAVDLTRVTGVPDEALDSAAQDALEGRRRKRWRKWADEPLGRRLSKRDGSATDRRWDPSDSTPWH